MTLHVAYGGAHLCRPGLTSKWRDLALATFDRALPHPGVLREVLPDIEGEEALHARVRARLKDAPLRALRIDFEDGYGTRDDAEEDQHAERAAALVPELAVSLGLRPKGLGPATRRRALATLERFFGALTAPLPAEFRVVLAKVERPSDVAFASGALASLEHRFQQRAIALEVMVETPELLAELDREGVEPLRRAADGRLRSLHLGAYDLLSALGVPGHAQSLAHPLLIGARTSITRAASLLGVSSYDGATLRMPTAQEPAAVRAALAEHVRDCRRAYDHGMQGSWDLHPGQLVSRWLAAAWAYHAGRERSVRRLEAFLRGAARASRLGEDFDDAASARGLVRWVLQGLDAGLLEPDELRELPVRAEQLRQPFDVLVRELATSAQLPR